MNTVLEVAGMVLLVVCAWLIFVPAAFGVAGILLIVAANMRATADTADAGDVP